VLADAPLTPFPEEASVDDRVNRWAGEHEQVESTWSALKMARGTANRGHDMYRLTLAAEQLARGARSDQQLYTAVRRALRDPEMVGATQDARRFVDVAVNTYRSANGIRDPDWSLIMALSLYQQYEQDRLADRRRRVGEIAREIEGDPIRQSQLKWSDRVNKLAKESGLSYEFVEAFLQEYHARSSQRFPGIIDPRGIPALQLSAPRFVIAKLIKDYLLPGFGTYEGLTGADVLTGERLSTAERALAVVGDLIGLVPGKAMRPIGRGAGRALRGARRGVESLRSLAAEWAGAASRLGRTAEDTLRFIGRLSRVPDERVAALLSRIRVARQGRQAVRLTTDEQRLIRELDHDFREFEGLAKLPEPTKKRLTAKGFIFLNRSQPRVLGRLLGQKMGRAARPAVRTELQVADDIADDLLKRMRAHWDAAVPRRGVSSDQAAQRVFESLRDARPANPNTWVRERFYDLWRKRALRRIYKDEALRRALRDEAGVIVGHNPRTKNYTMHIRTRSAGASRVQTPIDFDHADIGHSEAVQRAISTGDYRFLISTVSSGNLQLLTARENRNFIEALRAALREMGGE
jgi:hypothetical protein